MNKGIDLFRFYLSLFQTVRFTLLDKMILLTAGESVKGGNCIRWCMNTEL